MGVSAKKNFGIDLIQRTFYGIWTMNGGRGMNGGRYYLDGLYCAQEMVGRNNEEIKRKSDTRDWSKRMYVELDISFNGNIGDGTLMICRVPRTDDNAEIVIEGLNNCYNMYNRGYVPAVQLGSGQTVRVYSISPCLNGHTISLNWDDM